MGTGFNGARDPELAAFIAALFEAASNKEAALIAQAYAFYHKTKLVNEAETMLSLAFKAYQAETSNEAILAKIAEWRKIIR